jgi:hypothetical protein
MTMTVGVMRLTQHTGDMLQDLKAQEPMDTINASSGFHTLAFGTLTPSPPGLQGTVCAEPTCSIPSTNSEPIIVIAYVSGNSFSGPRSFAASGI